MKEGYAIEAFNVNNMEIIQGIMDATRESKSPVILQASSSAIKYARIGYLMKMVEEVEEHPEKVVDYAHSKGVVKLKQNLKISRNRR